MYKATVIWDGQTQIIDVAASETDLLVGMSLLYGFKVQIETVEGGTVTIEAYLEHKFTAYLAENYISQQGNSALGIDLQGNSALGIDLPALEVDIKVTSIKQPQSSCPFKSATQKVFGLGYHLLVFVYDK